MRPHIRATISSFHRTPPEADPLTSTADAPYADEAPDALAPDLATGGAPTIDAIDAAELETLDDPGASQDGDGHAPYAGGDIESADLQALILKKLDDDKAEDVVIIDLQGKSPIADAVVVASGRSQRHVAAIAEHLQRALKDAGLGRAPTEGLPHADWVLIDAGDVIVHLFRPEVRSFYQIEKIWSVDSPHRTASA